jgi:2-methylcitrate dehydratase PrpD
MNGIARERKMETILQRFADYFCTVRFEDLPAPVVHQAKLLTLDLMGVSIAGLKMDFPRMTIDYLSSLRGVEQATLLGAQGRVPAIHAALGNGVCGHALDMDDGYRFGGVHSGVAVIPAALAFSEAAGADGSAFLLSVVMGYEIVNRLSRAMNPSHLGRGFHTTGTIGVFGAAAACGMLAGLNRDAMASAMGMAGLQGAGLLEILNDGAMVKPIHPGKAGMAGILSVELAKRGAKGPLSVLEGQKGLFKAMADEISTDELFSKLGEQFLLSDQYIKLYAACRHIHPAMDGLLAVMKAKNLTFSDLESIDVATYAVAISFCGSPDMPQTAEAAKFSLAYSIAMAAYFGDAGEDRYVPSVVGNEDIRRLAARVSSRRDAKWEAAYPRQRGATVTITNCNGDVHTVEVPLAKGEPENPASDEDFIAKFRKNASGQDASAIDAMLDVVLSLERRPVSDLTDVMARIHA